MDKDRPSDETLGRMLEMQWQDHFQTRAQTWKALEISALVAVALVGVDWRLDNRWITVAISGLLLMLAQLGILMTLKHRKVERRSFRLILAIEEQLGAERLVSKHRLKRPRRIVWWQVFLFWHSNTPLFMLRMYVVIQVFAVCYLVFRLVEPLPR